MQSVYNISTLRCTGCGNPFYIPRPQRERAKYHLKGLYCPFCRSKQIFIEIRQFDYDIEEDEVINAGILRYFFAGYGYDFLRLLLWLPAIKDKEELHNIVMYINGSLPVQLLDQYFPLLKEVAISLKHHKSRLWRKIKALCKQANCPNKNPNRESNVFEIRIKRLRCAAEYVFLHKVV